MKQKKDKRGSYWKAISPEERSQRMTLIIKKRWAKTPLAKRRAYSKIANDAKALKKLSTPKRLLKKRS